MPEKAVTSASQSNCGEGSVLSAPKYSRGEELDSTWNPAFFAQVRSWIFRPSSAGKLYINLAYVRAWAFETKLLCDRSLGE